MNFYKQNIERIRRGLGGWGCCPRFQVSGDLPQVLTVDGWRSRAQSRVASWSNNRPLDSDGRLAPVY